MNNSSLKKRLLSVAMAAVVRAGDPSVSAVGIQGDLPAASGQIRTEQKRGGSDTYTVTRDVKSVAAAQTAR